MKIKPIAMYLPQFHRTPENDEWWGKGFTEWTAVKGAEAYFEGHNQPRVPLNNNYYNLLEKKTMEWQAELAQKYGVYGFCFYHYYFRDGRKILEKPAENLLKWKDIKVNYCFCWANETWARTWSKMNNVNFWASKYQSVNNDEKTILLEQKYGEEKDWKEHFEYLLSFFLDERYIKIENKPVFMIHKPKDIEKLAQMIDAWNTWAIEAGFSGIYFINTDTYELSGANATILRGPDAFVDNTIVGRKNENKFINQVLCRDYDEIWKNALILQPKTENVTFFEGFVDFDATARHEKKGWLIENVTPDKFGKYLYALAIKNMVYGNEYLFINAWNEWGEGNYLEPDTVNQFSFLEEIRKIVDRCDTSKINIYNEWDTITSKLLNVDTQYGNNFETEKCFQDEILKYKECFYLLNRWMFLRENDISVLDYLVQEGFNSIAIYGAAAIGKHLYDEIKKSNDVTIKYIIDRRKIEGIDDVLVVSPEEKIVDVDLIIITVVAGRDKLIKKLEQGSNAKVITLWDIIMNLIQKYEG